METQHGTQDLIVAGVAIALALLTLGAAATNWEPAYQLAKLRLLEARWGRRAARLVLAVIGLAMLAAAAAILRPWR